MDKLLSIVVPCFNEESVLPAFWTELCSVLKTIQQYRFEFIFVDDGSTDNTLTVLKKLSAEDKRVRYISFSRNFGKESAIFAGLKKSVGNLVVLMDADLQDPPALLPVMIQKLTHSDIDIVATKRKNRKGEAVMRSFFANTFYRLINRISWTKIESGSRDFRMMKRCVVNAILEVSEYNRFTKGIFPWVGFKTDWIAYENVPRKDGKTKWSFWGLFLYSINGITAFSTVPLAFASFLGLLFCFLSFCGIIFVIFQKLLFGGAAYGWSSLVCLLFFVSGIQLFCIGILGQYLSKTYMETKKRPLFIVREEL